MLVPKRIIIESTTFSPNAEACITHTREWYEPQISTDMLDLQCGNYPHIKLKDSVFNYEENYLEPQHRRFSSYERCAEFCESQNKCEPTAVMAEMAAICELAAISDYEYEEDEYI